MIQHFEVSIDFFDDPFNRHHTEFRSHLNLIIVIILSAYRLIFCPIVINHTGSVTDQQVGRVIVKEKLWRLVS